MRTFLALALLAAVAAADVAGLAREVRGRGNAARTWAVLIAGSNTWSNYRHQADVCHAYQVLRQLGVPEAQIIVMMYDDIAFHSSNPKKGQIFNEPGCLKDVYAGVPHDYTGKLVTTENLMKVMTGEVPAGGSGKTILSTAEDNVFLYYDDHGTVDLIAMPSGPNMRSADLQKVIDTMTAKKMYKNLVLYIQACESGSMFYKLDLPKNVYGVSSAPVDASAYAFNYDSTLRTYVASRWAYAWIIAAETQPSSYNFQQQFDSTWDYVKNWSQPCQYGDLALTKMNVHKFFNPEAQYSVAPRRADAGVFQDDAVRQCDVPYELAKRRYEAENSLEAAVALKREILAREKIDAAARRIVAAGNPAPHLQTVPCDACDRTCECFKNCYSSAKFCEFVCCNEQSCYERAPRNGDEARRLVALDCATELSALFHESCGSNDYVTSAYPLFARLCRTGTVDMAAAKAAIRRECA